MRAWTQRTVLSDVVDASTGFASGEDLDEGIFQIRMNNITSEGSLDLAKRRRVTLKSKRNGDLLLKSGDVLFNSTNSPELVGKSAVFDGVGEPATFSNHFVRLRPIEGALDGAFLSRWLHLQFQRGVFRGLCKQWVNQATVSRDLLLALELPLPPLPKQRRIAAILGQADALRAKRREGLAQLDSLTQSIFIEIFGDPRVNDRNWSARPVGDVTDCIVPGRDKPKSFSGDTPWVTTSDLVHLGTTVGSTKSIGLTNDEIRAVNARVIPRGSVVISCVGDLGIVSIAGKPMVVNQQLHSFQCGQEVNGLFLMYCLAFQKSFMHAMASSTTLPYMNKSVCNSIPVIVPPLPLQQTFASRIQAVESLKASHYAALAESDALFASLQHRAFAGQL